MAQQCRVTQGPAPEIPTYLGLADTGLVLTANPSALGAGLLVELEQHASLQTQRANNHCQRKGDGGENESGM